MAEINELLESAARSEGLEEHLPFIRSLLGHGIQLNPARSGKSAIGGRPRVPADFDWLEHARGLHTCIAQFDCSEFPTTSRLPTGSVITDVES